MNPLILVTNDDGIDSEGVRALADSLREIGEVYVFAPDRERSAVSHSLTLHRPLRLIEKEERSYAVDGTPADCVTLGLYFLGRKPDLLVSGINRGGNLGTDITYSGTVFAAIEGASQGIKSFAVSLAQESSPSPGGNAAVQWDFQPSARVARKIAAQLISGNILPSHAILNVNVPPLQFNEIKGYQITCQGKQVYHEVVVEKVDPRGIKYYWIGGNGPRHLEIENSDFFAIKEGYVSVTPLTLDFTCYPTIEKLKEWKL